MHRGQEQGRGEEGIPVVAVRGENRDKLRGGGKESKF